ncbi:MAG: hypothetical protein K2P94_12700 [Rhodospirillaceae bacterium]|nr:hypothetical protein [Rhodospirillaceae bacterium]
MAYILPTHATEIDETPRRGNGSLGQTKETHSGAGSPTSRYRLAHELLRNLENTELFHRKTLKLLSNEN